VVDHSHAESKSIRTSLRRKMRLIGDILRRNIPVTLNINLMYQTSFTCLLLMALFSLKSMADFVSEDVRRTDAINYLVLRLLDVSFLQALWVVVTAYVCLRALRIGGAVWARNRVNIVYPITVIVLMLCIEFGLEQLVFKPTFGFNRPADTIGEPWLTHFLRPFYDFEHLKGSSTPSGFMVRQTMLALLFAFAIHQPNFLKGRGTWKLGLLHLINIFLLFLMAWLRIYTGAHRLYDIAIAIGIGGFLFWAMIYVFLSFKDEIRRHIGDFALPAMTFAFMVLLYSQDFVRWVAFSVGTIGLLAFLYHPISSAPSCPRKG
jgi:PAP2 superfamily